MYQVIADIKYLDGALAGVSVPAGYRVAYPSKREAMRVVRWLSRVRAANDFIRATGTGNRYQIDGSILIEYRPALRASKREG